MIDIALLFLANDLLKGGVTQEKPPKSFVEQPPIAEVGYMSFAEWEKKFPGGSYLDYIDWVEGQ